jgi:hypothetical protein
MMLVALWLQGCILRSVHPFYKEGDITYRASLEGKWKDGEGVDWRIHHNPFDNNSYELHCSKNGAEATLLGHLFTLDGELYLDVVPLSDDREELTVFDLHMMPTHSIARVDLVDNDRVNIRWFNEEWLRNMFKQNKIKISHEVMMDPNPKGEDDGAYLLTATTDELQKFIMKYAKTEGAYDDQDLQLSLTRTSP